VAEDWDYPEDLPSLKTIQCTLEPAGSYRGKKRFTIKELPEIGATVHPWLEVARWYLLRGEAPETPITFRLEGERKTTLGAFVKAAQDEARRRLEKELAERDFPDAKARGAYRRQEDAKIMTMDLRVRMPDGIGHTDLGTASCLWMTDDLKRLPTGGKHFAWHIRMGRETRALLRGSRTAKRPA
jgi:hypothetical protein